LEKTMEADISIWRKPGHFYFALTRMRGVQNPELSAHSTAAHADAPPPPLAYFIFFNFRLSGPAA